MSTPISNKFKKILIKDPSKSRKKAPLQIIQLKSKIYLQNQYGSNCNLKNKYSYQVIDNLIFNRNSHLTTVFKDNMINDFIDEFLKRFYKKRESFKKIPQFTSFYLNYQRYFCIPTFRVKFYNKKIHYQREKKAKCFYNEKFKDKENHTFSANDIGICAASMGGEPRRGKIYLKNKNKNEKNNKTFFNKEVKNFIEKETVSINDNNNNTMSLKESGSKLRNNSSYLLNTTSNEESLCEIVNGLYKKKLFEFKSNIDTKRTNKSLSKKMRNKNGIYSTNSDYNKNNTNKNILNKKNNMKINNNIKLVLKKRVINIKNKYKNKNISNSNYETSDYNTKKVNNLSTNLANKLGIQNIKILLNNKDYEKTVNNKKFVGRVGLWNVINEKEKENRHLKSQDNIKKRNSNLLTFQRNKKLTRNVPYVTLYKKKSLPTSKSNISAKIKKIDFDKNVIQNIFKNNNINVFTKYNNYSKEKIRNMKKRSYRPIGLSKSNININNYDFKNPNDSLLNKIKKQVYDILQKKAQNKEKQSLKNKEDNSWKNNNNINYNSIKRTSNGLSIFYQNLNSNKENNYMTNNYRRNNKFDLKSNSNIFKSNKLAKSPSLSEFVKYIRIQRHNPTNKNSQRNFGTIEGKSNNIQNLNININNQINIRLNNINEMMPSGPLKNKKYQSQQKLLSRNKNKNIDFNTNQNFVIKYNSNLPTFFEQNNKKKTFRIFQNKQSSENNLQNKRNKRNNKFTYYKEKKTIDESRDKNIKKYNNLNLKNGA